MRANRHRRTLVAALIAMAAAAVVLRAAPAADVAVLAVEGRSNSTPSIAAAGSFVAVAWGATDSTGKTDVFLAVSRDGGVTFGNHVRVNSAPGTARLGGELPPRVALTRTASGRDPGIVVAWGSKTTTTDIRMARSDDGGRSFHDEAPLQSGVAGDRGWHALDLDDRGEPHVMWLDHRAMATRPKATEHDHHAGGTGMSEYSGLYYARTGSSPASERELFKGVCYCCKTALEVTSDGAIFAAWRHVYPGNIRDIAFTMSPDGGKTFSAPVRVSDDQWQLAGCPDDGPAMAVTAAMPGSPAKAGGFLVHVVWPTVITEKETTGALFYASSQDGRTFTPRQRIPTRGSPRPMHPQIAIGPAGGLTIAWDESIDGVRRAFTLGGKARADGQVSFGDAVALDANMPGAYPVMAATSSGVAVAWVKGIKESAVIAVSQP